MFTMVGLHGPPPTVLNNGDHWRLMVLATGCHSIVMLWRVGPFERLEVSCFGDPYC